MKLYGWLLKLLPRQFRARREAELLAAAEEQWRSAAPAGLASRARAALRLTIDIVAMAWSLRWSRLVAIVVQDARYATRSLRRSPGFTLVAVLTLGIGIAANTTVFSIVSAFYFAPAEFPDAGRLVSIVETSVTQLCAGCSVGTSAPGYAEWRTRAKSFENMGAYLEDGVVLSAPLTPQQVSAAFVSAELFPVLGVRPAMGRPFEPADDRPGAPFTIVLGHAIWTRQFGADRNVVGRTVRVNGAPAQVVGVMPPAFAFPSVAQIWMPLHAASASESRADRNLGVMARLRPHVAVAQARQEMQSIAADQAREHADTQREWSADVRTLRDERRAEGGPAFLTMLGAVAMVLAVACTNLAALVLARSARRRRELAVRSALGASRARLAVQLLAENVVLGVLGGGVGLLLSLWGVQIARSKMSDPVPYFIQIDLNWRVLAFCAVSAIVTGLLVGIGPAALTANPDLTSSLKDGGLAAGTSRRQRRWRKVLVSTELALVLVLLCGAALTGQSFLRLVDRPAGYDMTNLTLAQLPLSAPRFSDREALAAAIGDLDARLSAIGDARVALSHTEFIRGFAADGRSIHVDGRDVGTALSPSFALTVTPAFFDAQGLSIVGGRGFEGRDVSGSLPVVIVNQRLAGLVWPGGSPIGARVVLPIAGIETVEWTVVGVASNMEGEGNSRVQSFLYLPIAQRPGRPVDVLMRSPRGPESVLAAVRSAIAAVSADEPLTDERSAAEEHAREYWFVGYFAMFYVAFAAFALLLAMIGVYGVVSQAIGERTREFGIRIALGADRLRLYRLVIGETMSLTGFGILAGLAGAMATTRLLGWLLYGANPLDPMVLAGSALTLGAAAMLASYLPARRAVRTDPIRALRTE